MEVLLSPRTELPTVGSDPFSDKTLVPLWISWTSRDVLSVVAHTMKDSWALFWKDTPASSTVHIWVLFLKELNFSIQELVSLLLNNNTRYCWIITRLPPRSNNNFKNVNGDRICSRPCIPDGCLHLILRILPGKQPLFSTARGFVWLPPRRGQGWCVKVSPTLWTQGATRFFSSLHASGGVLFCSRSKFLSASHENIISWNSVLYETQ